MNLQQIKETVSHHRGVVFLCLTIFITSVGMGAISPVLPLFANQEYHVSRTQIGLAVGLFGMGRLVTSLPAGYLTQRYGRKFVLGLGTAINLLGASMVAISFSFVWLLVWRLVSGLGASMYTTGVSVYLHDVATPDNRARFLSLQEMSILLGQSLGPLTGGYIGEHFGLRTPLYLQAGLIAVALVTLLLLVPESRTREQVDIDSASTSRQLAAADRTAGGVTPVITQPRVYFRGPVQPDDRGQPPGRAVQHNASIW